MKAGMMADGTGQNGTIDALTAKQQRAAVLVSADDLTEVQIAAEIGIARSTLNRWRENPAFQDAIKAADAAILAKALRLPVARKYKRIETYQHLHDRHMRSLANEPDHVAVVTISKEIRANLEQTARETGEWSETVTVTGTHTVRVVGFSEDDV